MNSYAIYIFKVNIIFILTYLIYQLLFSKLTFHSINRSILLFLLLASFVIPSLTFNLDTNYIEELVVPIFEEQPTVVLNNTDNGRLASNALNVAFYLKIIYTLGVLIFAMRLVLNAFKIVALKQKSKTERLNGFYLVTANVPRVFSFFNWIFVPNHSSEYDPAIIEHEKAHIKQRHSLDLIITEFLIALLWFNPFVYLFRKSLRTVHECQVDSIVLQGNIKKSHYLQLLINNLSSNLELSNIYNHFNGLTIKKRIDMIIKDKSPKYQIARYLLFIPIIALLTMAFTNTAGDPPSIFPIEKGAKYRISQQYGVMFKNPFTKKKVNHKGLDIAAKEGVNVVATASGVIKKASSEKGYGNLIVIDHGTGFESWYAHLNDFSVKQGDKIEAGTIIGQVGNTGYSTGAHLHFEVRVNKKNVNPFDYIKE